MRVDLMWVAPIPSRFNASQGGSSSFLSGAAYAFSSDTNILTSFFNSRLQMVRELAYLQEMYPDIAVAVKTRRAARHVLNTSRTELDDLKKGGLLDDTVYHVLHRKIQMKMMHLRCAPTRMDPRPAVQTLRNLSWIAGNDDAFRYFKENVSQRHLVAGTTLCRQGDLSDGIYLIIYGVAKVSTQESEWRWGPG